MSDVLNYRLACVLAHMKGKGWGWGGSYLKMVKAAKLYSCRKKTDRRTDAYTRLVSNLNFVVDVGRRCGKRRVAAEWWFLGAILQKWSTETDAINKVLSL